MFKNSYPQNPRISRINGSLDTCLRRYEEMGITVCLTANSPHSREGGNPVPMFKLVLLYSDDHKIRDKVDCGSQFTQFCGQDLLCSVCSEHPCSDLFFPSAQNIPALICFPDQDGLYTFIMIITLMTVSYVKLVNPYRESENQISC